MKLLCLVLSCLDLLVTAARLPFHPQMLESCSKITGFTYTGTDTVVCHGIPRLELGHGAEAHRLKAGKNQTANTATSQNWL